AHVVGIGQTTREQLERRQQRGDGITQRVNELARGRADVGGRVGKPDQDGRRRHTNVVREGGRQPFGGTRRSLGCSAVFHFCTREVFKVAWSPEAIAVGRARTRVKIPFTAWHEECTVSCHDSEPRRPPPRLVRCRFYFSPRDRSSASTPSPV